MWTLGRFSWAKSFVFMVSFVLGLLLVVDCLMPVPVVAQESKVDASRDVDYGRVKPLDSVKVADPVLFNDASGATDYSVGNSPDRERVREDVSKRTENTSTFVNADGSKTMEFSPDQVNYRDGSKWKKIDNSLDPVEEDQGVLGWFSSWFTSNDPQAFQGDAGLISVDLKPFSDGVSFNVDGKRFSVKPVGGRDVLPERDGDNAVVYRDAWPFVDVKYELRGEAVKETIVVKNKKAAKSFVFDVDGGKVVNHPTKSGELTIEGIDPAFSFGVLTLDVHDRGVQSEPRVGQRVDGDGSGIRVWLDEAWVNGLPSDAFPIIIDPSFGRGASSIYMYKSDGYSCNSSNCTAHVGTLNDGSGWKSWRSYFNFPYNELAGKKVLNATVHGAFVPNYNGVTDLRWIAFGHANCLGYACTGQFLTNGQVSTDFNFDFTAGLQAAVDRNDFGAWWSVWGEEGAYKSYKPYSIFGVSVTYDSSTPVASPEIPAHNQVVVDSQPVLRVTPVTDGDGEAVQYYFRLSTNPDAETGAIVNSGWIDSTSFTVPDGVLQDGSVYYWHVYTKGGQVTSPNWVRSFKVDYRLGKDSTQTYDTLGPVGVSLATGIVDTSVDSHSMESLGGNLGIGLHYLSPSTPRHGLIAKYWNVGNDYDFSRGVPTTNPVLTKRESMIDMDWGMGSPNPGVNSDGVFVQWNGYFVAPNSGDYYFGSVLDDRMTVRVNNNVVYSKGCCNLNDFTGSQKVTLKAGEVVPISVDYFEYTGRAYAKLLVKGAVSEQVVPREWLFTEVVKEEQKHGLTGHYYTNPGVADIDAAAKDPSRLLMVRRDPAMYLNFGTGGIAQGMPVDNFMARWTGYLTVPTSGEYTLGAYADDGIRIKLGLNPNSEPVTLVDSWRDQAGEFWSNTVRLEAGKPIPITVDWYERSGYAALNLLIKSATMPFQTIPSSWLTPDAFVLPEQWTMNVDADGDVAYERLRVSGNNVILEDSTRGTHLYTGTGQGYKPPVNEDGQLFKNTDNTYTLIDGDGRTYIFNAEGVLASVTQPTDDRQPAALKYEYAGSPSKLVSITDGASNERKATLTYNDTTQSADQCVAGSGFDPVPVGMLCSLVTSDGDKTTFHYKNGQLARIEKPGNDFTDYGYDTLGRLTSVRGTLENDVIAAGIRPDDDSTKVSITYDVIGRASTVTGPAPTQEAKQIVHRLEYVPGSTLMHIDGTSEPQGFSKKIDYDSLLRTVKETDLTGKTSEQEWDPVKDLILSTTDPTGLKSTTIYDLDDRKIEAYGPAPKEWFTTSRVPLPDKTNLTPHTSTRYDEGIDGLAASYYTVKDRPMSVLSPWQELHPGDSITSTDGRFRFVYQTDGNLGVYGPNGAMWASNTAGRPSNRLLLQSDGNMALFNGTSVAWMTGSVNPYGGDVRLEIQNDGNLVIRSQAGAFWHTNTARFTANGANTSLIGQPKVNTTNIGTNAAQESHTWTGSPLPDKAMTWGLRLSGKLYLPTVGTWKLRIVSDSGTRVSVDDVNVIDDWVDGTNRSHPIASINNTQANMPHRISIDYYHLAAQGNASFTLYLTNPSGVETADVRQYLKPGYSLTTSTKAHDSEQRQP
ncbi:YD repeat-containing protein [Arcanobacterium pluranimalium]|uniref:PA14 domain-containing protein n=1 Tax=Arcanobacterium pluranimalium TaxID=108028 RepID=UPI001958D995|nr:YD repeat-containing protein [Arcanobacterium pluranimalium]